MAVSRCQMETLSQQPIENMCHGLLGILQVRLNCLQIGKVKLGREYFPQSLICLLGHKFSFNAQPQNLENRVVIGECAAKRFPDHRYSINRDRR